MKTKKKNKKTSELVCRMKKKRERNVNGSRFEYMTPKMVRMMEFKSLKIFQTPEKPFERLEKK